MADLVASQPAFESRLRHALAMCDEDPKMFLAATTAFLVRHYPREFPSFVSAADFLQSEQRGSALHHVQSSMRALSVRDSDVSQGIPSGDALPPPRKVHTNHVQSTIGQLLNDGSCEQQEDVTAPKPSKRPVASHASSDGVGSLDFGTLMQHGYDNGDGASVSSSARRPLSSRSAHDSAIGGIVQHEFLQGDFDNGPYRQQRRAGSNVASRMGQHSASHLGFSAQEPPQNDPSVSPLRSGRAAGKFRRDSTFSLAEGSTQPQAEPIPGRRSAASHAPQSTIWTCLQHDEDGALPARTSTSRQSYRPY